MNDSLMVRVATALLATGLVALGAIAPAAARPESDGPDVVGHNCHEFVAMPDVPYEEAQRLLPEGPDYVARHDRVSQPPGFGNLEDPAADTAKLFIAARRCEVLEAFGTFDRNVIEAYISVPIDPPETAPRESSFGLSGTGISLSPLENYLAQWVTNSPLRAAWLVQETGVAEERVRLIDDRL